jgi:diguanylate cyclase (GGDEF)-like protein
LPKNTIHFLHSLIALTKERDLFELENTLKNSISELIRLTSGAEVVSAKIFHLRDVSKAFFTVVSEGNHESVQEISPALCQQLLDCYNTGEYKIYKDQQRIVHFFPLKHDVAHQNVVVMVEAAFDDAVLSQAICKLLNVYQNYINLLNDNERDTLTGLLNRKTFDIKINKILSHVDKKNMRKHDRDIQAYYLAIFDIDHFKKVNDQYGHLIGDEVLLLFSQIMTKTFRESDPLFRFGGEEFVGLFGCVDDADIALVLNRFAKKLNDFNFPQVGKVSVSIGCAKLSADIAPSQLVDRADLALYYAKNNGRNQICYYEQLVEQGLLKEEDKSGEIELF